MAMSTRERLGAKWIKAGENLKLWLKVWQSLDNARNYSIKELKQIRDKIKGGVK